MKKFSVKVGDRAFITAAKTDIEAAQKVRRYLADMAAKDSPVKFLPNLNIEAFKKNIANMKKDSSSLNSFKANLNSILADVDDWRRYATQQTAFDDMEDLRVNCLARCNLYIKLLSNVATDKAVLANLDNETKSLINKCINNLNAAKSNYFSNYKRASK